MVEIIPAIIARNFTELQEKIKLVEPHVETVQLDVMDGVFVNNKTWPYSALQDGSTNGTLFLEDLDKLGTSLRFEVHLMIEAPQLTLERWLISPKILRVILHWEELEKGYERKLKLGDELLIYDLSRKIRQSGKEFGVALNPETPIEVLDNFINEVDLVLLMSVDPGFAGQEFKEGVIPKITALCQRHKNVKIEVDGGLNLQNILELVKAGADYLVMGSAIFNCPDPRVIIEKVHEIINKA